MQIPPKDIVLLIGVVTLIFLIAPLFLIFYISLYNRRKKKHTEETAMLKQSFENELLRSQMEVQEQTLKTIAYDLHDNIGQLLGLTIITLGSVNSSNIEKTAEKVTTAEELAKRALKEVRTLSRLLHGEELISRGLAAAISFELEWLERSQVFRIIYNNNAGTLPSSSDKEIIIFRLFQELLNNSVRHAKATEIRIDLSFAVGMLTLTVSDNGAGFDLVETLKLYKGMGLQHLYKRAGMIGGQVSIVTQPGNGTTTTISVPC
ncbi:MAG TPA: sensor histidine kinase [Chitinophaga sp.]|uniref:sensor histidine kinase n=1 Tax=Chitinophaga sp. TaxID=1869181 RepID=UPI002C3ED167|nr:sensor histidine kinase [Chitinophaga sp.]HVI47199.1 sensor histidine kinase [Chitinophaga sp.]